MTDNNRYVTILIVLGLAAAVVLVYFQVANHEFVDYDDDEHVFANRYVSTGISAENTTWAFGIHGPSSWHPLTWLSLQLDCQLYGLNARGHHLTNAAFHLGSVIVLFLALKSMSRAVWPSAFASALFAVHPLNVESVAWVTERKDVLSTFFWMLTLWAYSAYARRGNRDRYLTMLGVFVLGLTAKPMLVTLPFVLLLLDFWPLGRLRLFAATEAELDVGPPDGQCDFDARPLRFLLFEKVPLLFFAVVSAVLTILCQHSMKAIENLESLSLALRMANSLVVYVTYIRKTFWPADLAAFYPHPIRVGLDPFWSLIVPAVGAAVLLAVVTYIVIRSARRRPYLLVGWFWFLGTLLPVIGVVQVGEQQMADRYTYVPHIGLFIGLSWLAADVAAKRLKQHYLPPVLAATVLAALMTAAWFQVGYWRNTVTLFEHAVAVTENNYLAHIGLGTKLTEQGRTAKAIGHLNEALRIAPEHPMTHFNLANIYRNLARYDKAIHHYQQAIQFDPNYADAHNNWGMTLALKGDSVSAAEHYRAAIKLRPDYALAHNNLGAALVSQGKVKEAVAHYRSALNIQPDMSQAASNFAWVLATVDDPDIRDGAEAVRLAEQARRQLGAHSPQVLDILAAAYAEAGQFEKAVATVHIALQLAGAAGLERRAAAIRQRMKLYRNKRPYRQSFAPVNR